jgi:hypothetical protein
VRVGSGLPSNPGITKHPAALAIFLLFILSPMSFIAELQIRSRMSDEMRPCTQTRRSVLMNERIWV